MQIDEIEPMPFRPSARPHTLDALAHGLRVGAQLALLPDTPAVRVADALLVDSASITMRNGLYSV